MSSDCALLVLQGLLLSAYLKMLLADPNDEQLLQQVGAVYERYSHFMDADLQQRAVEYQGLLKRPDVANRNVTAMPKWEKRKSLLLRRMAEKDVSAVLPWPLHASCPVCIEDGSCSGVLDASQHCIRCVHHKELHEA